MARRKKLTKVVITVVLVILVIVSWCKLRVSNYVESDPRPVPQKEARDQNSGSVRVETEQGGKPGREVDFQKNLALAVIVPTSLYFISLFATLFAPLTSRDAPSPIAGRLRAHILIACLVVIISNSAIRIPLLLNVSGTRASDLICTMNNTVMLSFALFWSEGRFGTQSPPNTSKISILMTKYVLIAGVGFIIGSCGAFLDNGQLKDDETDFVINCLRVIGLGLNLISIIMSAVGLGKRRMRNRMVKRSLEMIAIVWAVSCIISYIIYIIVVEAAIKNSWNCKPSPKGFFDMIPLAPSRFKENVSCDSQDGLKTYASFGFQFGTIIGEIGTWSLIPITLYMFSLNKLPDVGDIGYEDKARVEESLWEPVENPGHELYNLYP